MLTVVVAIFSVAWALWLEYLLFHPKGWDHFVDRQHDFLRSYGVSVPWMQRLEKGKCLKLMVALTTFLAIVCWAILLTQPSTILDTH